jgi:hypothetical protein
MDDVVTIAPLLDEPGLIAYECPRCGYITSLLVPADDPKARVEAHCPSARGQPTEAPPVVLGIGQRSAGRRQGWLSPMVSLRWHKAGA